MLGKAQKYVARSEVNKRATAQFERIGIMQQAKNVAENVKHRVGEAVHQYNASPSRPTNNQGNVTDSKGFEQAMTEAEQAATASI
jgi:hypothetical protein